MDSNQAFVPIEFLYFPSVLISFFIEIMSRDASKLLSWCPREVLLLQVLIIQLKIFMDRYYVTETLTLCNLSM